MRVTFQVFQKGMIGFVLVLLLSANGFADTLRNVSFFQTIVSKQRGVMFQGQVWMKDGAMRMMYPTPQGDAISIIKEGKSYNFSFSAGTGAVADVKTNDRFRFGPEIIQSKEKLLNFLHEVGAVVMETEEIEGYSCSVYEYAYNLGPDHVNNLIWIVNEDIFPMKSIVTIEGKDTVTILYQNVELGIEIDDALFEIPDNIRFFEQ